MYDSCDFMTDNWRHTENTLVQVLEGDLTCAIRGVMVIDQKLRKVIFIFFATNFWWNGKFYIPAACHVHCKEPASHFLQWPFPMPNSTFAFYSYLSANSSMFVSATMIGNPLVHKCIQGS